MSLKSPPRHGPLDTHSQFSRRIKPGHFILPGLFLLILISISGWVVLAGWPDPQPEPLPWRPDAIVILGGGLEDRTRPGKWMADQYPGIPVIVTGDGGLIVHGLRLRGLPERLIHHEDQAKSTMDNARLTIPELDRIEAHRVALVTGWYHAPRALAVFRKVQPNREFAVWFEPKHLPLKRTDLLAQKRERLAALWYALRYGVYSWCK